MAINVGSNALASDFISTSAGAGDSGKVAKMDSDGHLSNTFLKKYKMNTTTSYSVAIALDFSLFEQYEATAQDHAVSFATPLNMDFGKEMTVSLKMLSDRAYSDTDNFFYTDTAPTTLEKDYVYLFTIKRISQSGYAISWSRYLYINKSIKFVGAITQRGNIANNVSLTALTGGIGTTALENDLVIVLLSSTTTAQTLAMTTAGYTQLDIQRNSSDTRSTASALFIKRMGATPDTTAQVTSIGNYAFIAYVLRGVHTTTAVDVTTVGTTGNNENAIDSLAITPITGGAFVMTLGAGSVDSDGAVVTVIPAGFVNAFSQNTVTGGTGLVAVCALKRWTAIDGSLNPPLWSLSVGGTSESYSAFTLAIRPMTE